jgi:hypothetical protein
MYRMGVLERFLWGISVSMAVWLVAYGAARASEGVAILRDPDSSGDRVAGRDGGTDVRGARLRQ